MTHQFMTLVDLLRQRASQQPSQHAYTFLSDGETEALSQSYADLDRHARTIAAALIEHGLSGARALLLYQPGLEYIAAFFGCLYAGVVAVPAYPPRPVRLERSLPRLRAIADDAQPAVALTTASFLELEAALSAHSPVFERMRWLATDTLSDDAAAEWRDPGVTPDTLAFLQYTSGSTAAPKGVMLSHCNLLHNSALIHGAFGHSEQSRGVIWLPPYHDMGLIGGIIQPLYAGFPVTLLSPVNFLQRPLRWLEAISRFGATTSGGPNFAYDLCVRKTTPEQRAQLDLSSWQVAFTGAEPIQAQTLDRFAAAFAVAGFRRAAFYPCYGLAEATLIVSGGTVTAAPPVRLFDTAALEQGRVALADDTQAACRALVGCGHVLGEQRVVIAEPTTRRRCESEQIGEIWVAGASVAQGYWNQPEATARDFQATLADGSATRFLRTGDLGFIHDGELFVTGRIKDLIIIRGRNHYPQDIELTVEQSHAALRPGSGAAVAIERDGEERLVIVQEIERLARNQDITPVVSAIRQALAELHELHADTIVLIKPGSIPKTSSGKIQRHQCRAGFLAGTLDVVGSSSEHEQAAHESPDPPLSRAELLAHVPSTRPALLRSALQAQAARLLRVPVATIDPQQPISALGLDSLMAVEWQHTLEDSLQISVPMVQFLEADSIAQLAETISAALLHDAPAPVAHHDPPSTYPLSAGQRALWFLHQLAPDSAAYNIATAVRIRSALDVPALRRALQTLVERHALLRTTFTAAHGEPIQQVQPQATVALHELDAADWSSAALSAYLTSAAQRPFDLQHGPLLRLHLLTSAPEEHVLLLVIHHIVADFWSLAVLVQELNVLYPAAQSGSPATLTPLRIDYSAYVAREAALLAGAEGDRLWRYWQQHLRPSHGGALPLLNLPTDRPRPLVQTYHGATHSFALSADLTRQLKALSRSEQATLYMTLLAAFNVLLQRWSGQDDIVVGTPSAGRSSSDLAGLVGYLINPLVIRADLAGNPSFATLLGRIRQTTLQALAHQHYPFALLVERLQPDRDASRSPLFQVMFILQKTPLNEHLGAFAVGQDGAQIELGGLRVESLALEQSIAQFDLTLTMAEVAGRLVGGLQYNTDLFDAATIARMAGHFVTLLDGIAADPDRAIGLLPLLSQHEQEQLRAWNSAAQVEPAQRSLHTWVEAQAARTPDAVAVICPERPGMTTTQLTYRALNERADQLAHYLRTLGVGRCDPHGAPLDVPCGIYMERSADLVVALLAVLKAGGAYVPLDPHYPPERIGFVLADTQMPVLLTSAALADTWPDTPHNEAAHRPQVVCVDRDWPTIAQAHAPLTPSSDWSERLAYVIYTSGSTGRPKGVAITHRGASTLIAWAQTVFRPDQLACVLAATSISFDLSVFELFVPLSTGGAVVLVENVLQLATLPATTGVTLINTVPSAITELLRLGALPPSARTINLAGEPLTRRLVEQLYQQPTVAQVFNLYGPSEDTTYSTFALTAPNETPTIGQPIANTVVYLLDRSMQPVPLGVAGELYLGGDGLARGYLNRAAQTAAGFVPDPFSRPEGTRPGRRLYRTGDLARWLADGQIEFLGRADHQIKLRGFRIELGEIESVLMQHPAVRECAVLLREDAPGDQRLVAYVIEEPRTKNQEPGDGEPRTGALRANQEPGGGGEGTREQGNKGTGEQENKRTREQRDESADRIEGEEAGIDADGSQFLVLGSSDSSQFLVLGSMHELREFVQARVPAYMVPSAFVWLPALPLTPNGKLDRKALPAPDRSRDETSDALVLPRTPIEAELVTIWTSLLNLEQVSIHDNFFHVGGHSLLAVQLGARLRETFQVDVPLHSLFETPTIAGIARHIEMLRWAAEGMQTHDDTDAEDVEAGFL